MSELVITALIRSGVRTMPLSALGGTMNADHVEWCHQCDVPVLDWAEFVAHANAGHAITQGRCPGACSFAA